MERATGIELAFSAWEVALDPPLGRRHSSNRHREYPSAAIVEGTLVARPPGARLTALTWCLTGSRCFEACSMFGTSTERFTTPYDRCTSASFGRS